jgi:hypothetical protein
LPPEIWLYESALKLARISLKVSRAADKYKGQMTERVERETTREEEKMERVGTDDERHTTSPTHRAGSIPS